MFVKSRNKFIQAHTSHILNQRFGNLRMIEHNKSIAIIHCIILQRDLTKYAWTLTFYLVLLFYDDHVFMTFNIQTYTEDM